MNGTNDAAFAEKHATAPRLAIITPASAGPRMRDKLNCVAFSASAVPTSSRPTMERVIV